jgi:hypothetical protein
MSQRERAEKAEEGAQVRKSENCGDVVKDWFKDFGTRMHLQLTVNQRSTRTLKSTSECTKYIGRILTRGIMGS